MRRGGTAGGQGSGFRLAGAPRRRARNGESRLGERGEVIFEFYLVGRYVKVSAMHAPTLTEVSFVCDPSRGEAELKAVALRKLRYVLERKARGGQ